MKAAQILIFILATAVSGSAMMPRASASSAPKLEIGKSPVRGSKKAKVTIYEFSDFQCPYCAQVVPTLEALMKKYNGKIRLVYKFFPIPELHPDAMSAAEAAVAAQNQGKFWQMHDLLFSHQRNLSQDDLVNYAQKLKLDISKFKKDMKDPKTSSRIHEDIALADSRGFSGTPSFLINGESMVGAASEDEFSQIIDKALK